jgi:hypothetical protein
MRGARSAGCGIVAAGLAPTAALPQPSSQPGISPEMFDWSGVWMAPAIGFFFFLVLVLVACLVVGLVHWILVHRRRSSPADGRSAGRAR